MLTGDSQVEQTLSRLFRISSFIDHQGGAYAIRYPPFRAYLQHKAETTWNQKEVDALYANAGMYFQLHSDLPAALDCYVRSGNHAKVSELLVEHSRQHPGHGAYYQLRGYYRAHPEREILASPELMSGMSVLCSLTFDVEGSERWYAALKDYADGLDRRSPERKAAQGLVDYLNITLPHRGSINIRDILMTAYTVVHMFTTDINGKTPGEVEKPTVTNTDKGIQFTVTGLSPISVGWTEPVALPPAPSGSGGGSGVSTCTITAGKPDHGTVTVSRERASKGTAVTVTATPDKGYVLDALTVTDAKGNKLELTEKDDGKYAFKMPGGKVSVAAVFAPPLKRDPPPAAAERTAPPIASPIWTCPPGITTVSTTAWKRG